MKKSCIYCGRVHDIKYQCPQKPKTVNNKYREDKKLCAFRSSAAWQRKRRAIVQRDLHCCRVCLTEGRYAHDIQVHHIIPLAVDYDKRLDDDNLISLCAYHHEQAESGAIPPEALRRLAAEDIPPGIGRQNEHEI